MGGVETEHPTVEGKFCLQGDLNSFTAAETMSLGFEREMRNRDASGVEGGDHRLGLGRRHHFVVEALQEEDGT